MLMHSIGIGVSVSMIRAVPWRSEPGWMATCAWHCACCNGPNLIFNKQQPIRLMQTRT